MIPGNDHRRSSILANQTGFGSGNSTEPVVNRFTYNEFLFLSRGGASEDALTPFAKSIFDQEKSNLRLAKRHSDQWNKLTEEQRSLIEKLAPKELVSISIDSGARHWTEAEPDVIALAEHLHLVRPPEMGEAKKGEGADSTITNRGNSWLGPIRRFASSIILPFAPKFLRASPGTSPAEEHFGDVVQFPTVVASSDSVVEQASIESLAHGLVGFLSDLSTEDRKALLYQINQELHPDQRIIIQTALNDPKRDTRSNDGKLGLHAFIAMIARELDQHEGNNAIFADFADSFQSEHISKTQPPVGNADSSSGFAHKLVAAVRGLSKTSQGPEIIGRIIPLLKQNLPADVVEIANKMITKDTASLHGRNDQLYLDLSTFMYGLIASSELWDRLAQ